MASSSPSYQVDLYVYDLSRGMAKSMSQAFIGKQIDGIWHTGIVIHYTSILKEIYYGGGIQISNAGMTQAGRPTQILNLGYTEIPKDLLDQYLEEIKPMFTHEKYDLLHNNCNNFTNEVCKFLLGKEIPNWIIGLPLEFLSTPMGQMLTPMLNQMQGQMKNNGNTIPFTNMNTSTYNVLDSNKILPVTNVADKININSKLEKQNDFIVYDELTIPPVKDQHVHTTLLLKVISKSAKPLLSKDNKAAQYVEMIKKINSSLSTPEALTADELLILNAFNAYDVDNNLILPDNSVYMFSKLLKWKTTNLFAVLSLMKLALLHPKANSYFVSNFSDFSNLLSNFSTLSAPVQLLLLCSFSNLFKFSNSYNLLKPDSKYIDPIIELCRFALESKSKVLRIMGANVLYNISLGLERGESGVMLEIVTMLSHSCNEEKDENTLLRLLSAIGQLIYCNDLAVEMLQGFKPTLTSNCNDVFRDVEILLNSVDFNNF